MKPLVNFYDGEPWFDNPQLIVAGNRPRKRRVSMRRRARHNRRRHRRNFYGAGMVNRKHHRRRRFRMNRKRYHRRSYMHNRRHRRHYRANYRRRHYRRNPEGGRGIRIAGISLPPLETIAWTGAGLIVPQMLTSYVTPMLPTSWTSSPYAGFVVKGAMIVIPGIAIKRMVSPRAGNLFMIGGFTSLTLDLLKYFFPTLPFGMGQWQPMLGSYFSYPGAPGRIVGLPRKTVSQGLPPMISEAPDRLNPASRF